MSRVGHKFVPQGEGPPRRDRIDAGPGEFGETMGYGSLDGFGSRDHFLKVHCSAPWIVETRGAVASLLRKERPVLAVGSGIGEHVVPLVLEGFDVTASDIIPGVLDRTRALFPALKTRTVDVFRGDLRPGEYADVLDEGLLSYYDDDRASELFACLSGALAPGGRLLTVHRYNDNACTWAIDSLLLPGEAFLKNAAGRCGSSGRRFVRKAHGHRRSRGEVKALARAAGLRPKRVRHAGFGMELSRSAVLSRIPGLPSTARLCDRALRLFNNVTVFEFEKSGGEK